NNVFGVAKCANKAADDTDFADAATINVIRVIRGLVRVFRGSYFGCSLATLCLSVTLVLSGCGEKTQAKTDGNDTGPHTAVIEPDLNADNFKVDHPERFPVVSAGEYMATPELNVNGVVSADATRQVPVPSLTSGRVLEIDAKVGDAVKKGQVLFKV